jgi:hypothetical protein
MLSNSVSCKLVTNEGSINILAEPSVRAQNRVYVSINHEYQVPKIFDPSAYQIFDLTPLVRGFFPKAREAALKQMSQILEEMRSW